MQYPEDFLLSVGRSIFGNALYRTLESFDQALAAYDSALALQPDHVEALYRRSDLLARSGDLEAAAAGFKSVLALQSEHVGSLVEPERAGKRHPAPRAGHCP